MSFVQLVEVSLDHIPPIAERMRDADVEEVRAFGFSPAEALRVSALGSVDAFTVLIDGKPEAMLGLTPKSLVEGIGGPWMLGTEAIYREGRALLQWGPKVMALWGDSTPDMEGLVAATNARAIRMLWRWGFKVGEERQVIGGTEFVQFTREGR